MATFKATVRASKPGGIGMKYGEVREYVLEASTREGAMGLAREEAANEGLEHTLVTDIRKIKEV